MGFHDSDDGVSLPSPGGMDSEGKGVGARVDVNCQHVGGSKR
jgi:hypothetical protein